MTQLAVCTSCPETTSTGTALAVQHALTPASEHPSLSSAMSLTEGGREGEGGGGGGGGGVWEKEGNTEVYTEGKRCGRKNKG